MSYEYTYDKRVLSYYLYRAMLAHSARNIFHCVPKVLLQQIHYYPLEIEFNERFINVVSEIPRRGIRHQIIWYKKEFSRVCNIQYQDKYFKMTAMSDYNR